MLITSLTSTIREAIVDKYFSEESKGLIKASDYSNLYAIFHKAVEKEYIGSMWYNNFHNLDILKEVSGKLKEVTCQGNTEEAFVQMILSLTVTSQINYLGSKIQVGEITRLHEELTRINTSMKGTPLAVILPCLIYPETPGGIEARSLFSSIAIMIAAGEFEPSPKELIVYRVLCRHLLPDTLTDVLYALNELPVPSYTMLSDLGFPTLARLLNRKLTCTIQTQEFLAM